MVKLVFTGDLLCTPRMTNLANGNYDSIFEKTTKLKDCDYLIGNLETPVAGEDLEYTHERYCFNTPKSFITSMKKAGFDLLTLANNHCMDRDEEGIEITLKNCKSEGFDTIGLYNSQKERDEIFIREFDDIKIAFINYTYGTNAFAHKRFLKNKYKVNLFQPEETLEGSIHLLNTNEKIAEDLKRIYFDKSEEYQLVAPFLSQLENDIKKAKECADYVIMIMHCGGQYNKEIDPYSKFIAKKIKEYGADIIIGHHPHIIQESELCDDYLTVFSLGNLLNDPVCPYGKNYNHIHHDYSAVLYLSLKKDENGKITDKKEFGIFTTVLDENGMPQIIDSNELNNDMCETAIREDIINYANLFAGKTQYKAVQERYEL